MDIYNLLSFCGLFVFIGLAWLFSTDRRKFNTRVVFWGLVLQFLFGMFIFVVPAGRELFLLVNSAVVVLLQPAAAGAHFLFGILALEPGTQGPGGESSLGFFLAFQVLPTIVFFSALVAILYYYRVMPLLIRTFSRVFSRLMHLSGAESLCAASNIFVGVESALTIKPYLQAMTRSELCAVLTAGMATVSSNVLAAYTATLVGQFPTIAGHLVSASFLSAPAALVMAKILLPESEKPETLGHNIEVYYERESNLFATVIKGANAGLKLISGIVALLLAVLGLVALLDLLLGTAGSGINGLLGSDIEWSLKNLLGYVFRPLCLAMGIPPADAALSAGIISERLVLTEFVSFSDLAQAMEQGAFSSPRSAVITAYALCGFAHVASMAIFVGGVAALAPERTRILAEVSFRALLAATLACMMTGCIAGIFFNNTSVLLTN